MERFAKISTAVFLPPTRLARRIYRYVTGNGTCFAFVRFTLSVFSFAMILDAVVFVTEHKAVPALIGIAGVAIPLRFRKTIFQAAAEQDTTRSGPSIHAMNPVMNPVMAYAFFGFSSWLLVVLTAQSFYGFIVDGRPLHIVTNTLGLSGIFIVWAFHNNSGSDGERNLRKDLRSLLHRPSFIPNLGGTN